jgi:hypothetical protein
MYYKLVEITEFDANEQLYSSKAIVAVIMAKNKADAKNWFKKFAQYGIISMSNVAEVEEATEDEYNDFIQKFFD